MKNICIDMLDMLSELAKKISEVEDFDLTLVYTNTQYQEYLENVFGEEGNVTATITENQLLTPNERSFFLLLAIFIEQVRFYKILDQIHSMSLKQVPGYNWELLTSLKSINDHCFNTKVRQTHDYFKYTDTCAIDIFFNNFLLGNIIVTEYNFRLALRSLIAKSIRTLDQERNLNAADYKDDQRRIIRTVANFTHDANWRLQKSGMTLDQIKQGGKGIFSIYDTLKHAGVTSLHEQIKEHRAQCPNVGCNAEQMLIETIKNLNYSSDTAVAANELVMLKESNKLYKEQKKAAEKNPHPRLDPDIAGATNRCTIV